MMPFLRLHFCAFFLLISFVSSAQNALVVTEEKEVYNLGKYVSVFEDTSANLSFEQITTPNFQNKFVPSKVNALNYGVTSSAIWVKINLQNQVIDPNIQWVLSLDHPLFDYVTFYQKNASNVWTKLETGDMFPFMKRQIPNRNFVFSLYMPNEILYSYYLRFETSSSMQINPQLYRERAFLVENTFTELMYGLFFGGMLIIMFYNLFLFFSLKDWAYLAYCFFIITVLFQQSAFSGHINQYFLENNPYWTNQIIPLGMIINPIAMALFSITFLKTWKFAPFWHKVLISIIIVGCLHIVASFFLPTSIATSISGAIIIFTLFIVIIAGIISYRKGNKSARFYLLAWSLLVVTGLISSFRLFGLLPTNTFTFHGVKVAILLETVLLALALADKYNLFKKEKEEAQEKVLKIQKEANKVLEDRVRKRTIELSLTNDKLSETLSEVEEERQKSDKLLLNILPAETATELKEKGFSTPKQYHLVTVLFTDFKNFTYLVESLPPNKIIEVLDICFLAFDEICERNNIEKIKTIGDSYMAAGGLPLANTTNPVDALKAALEIQEWLANWNQENFAAEKQKWEVRIGLHSGPVMAGVVGKNKFAYDIWGETVNIASRMESAGEVGQVSISKTTYELVKDYFDCEYKGKVAAKNIKDMEVYWVKKDLRDEGLPQTRNP